MLSRAMHYPAHLKKLIISLTCLPGVGTKTAERYAFHLLRWKGERLEELARVVQDIALELQHCLECGCLTDRAEGCRFCNSDRRSKQQLCIVSSPKDVFAIEGTGDFRGLYQVLAGLLSPLDGHGPDLLHLDDLNARIAALEVEEVIIALDSTLEGDATALYLKEHLQPKSLRVSRLAFGLPMGSALEYVDGGTLARALTGRQPV